MVKGVNMKYIIMCAGDGKRWGNYLGIPKHFVKINGETLIGRTTRLLKENGITDYIITTSDERYKQYGETKPQSYNDCEVDRFEETNDEQVCYLYGDVYYTEEALKTIINTPTDDILFFGSEMEIVGVKVVNKDLFFEHKNKVKQLYLNGEISRCIGWEVYKSLNELPLEEYAITDRFYLINDGTDDIDSPSNYLDFLYKFEGGKEMIKVEVVKEFTLERFGEIENLKRKSIDPGKGRLLVGDIFECTRSLADYLMGGNEKKVVVVKVIEVTPKEEKKVNIKPDIKIEETNIEEIIEKTKEIVKQKPKKKKTKK